LRGGARLVRGYEVVEAGDLGVGNASKGVDHPGLRIDTVELCGLPEGVGDGGGHAAGLRADEEVVLAPPTPSSVHSAHVGQFPSYTAVGTRLSGGGRVERVDSRKTGRFVHVEVLPGAFTVLAEWMLDASACVGMEISAPRASIEALADLDDLLKRRGLRLSCSGDSAAGEERPDARPKDHAAIADAAVDAVRLDSASQNEPARSQTGRDAARDPADGSGYGGRRGGVR
jgi:hypothetical protein